MKMKLALMLVILMGLLASTAEAQTNSYTCTYRVTVQGISFYAKAYGPDNMPIFCSSLKGGLGRSAVRVSSYSLPARRCTFEASDELSIYVNIHMTSAYLGRKMCDSLEARGWYRIR